MRAKLAFFDIGEYVVSSGVKQSKLRVPADLKVGMFPVAYNNTARIHSNSWGSESNKYDSLAQEMDSFMFDNDDMLVLVAAGNTGQHGAGSIGLPATAKNIIAVGATTQSANAVAYFRLQAAAHASHHVDNHCFVVVVVAVVDVVCAVRVARPPMGV